MMNDMKLQAIAKEVGLPLEVVQEAQNIALWAKAEDAIATLGAVIAIALDKDSNNDTAEDMHIRLAQFEWYLAKTVGLLKPEYSSQGGKVRAIAIRAEQFSLTRKELLKCLAAENN